MPSFLVVGATGNTGGAVLQYLADVLPQSDKFSQYRIIGLTRDANGAKALELAKLPRVEMLAKDWTLIDSNWLREHEVERLYIAPHIGVSAFADESLFFTYALEAGVKYAVKLSTTATNVRPTTPVYYARNHWAVETMLEQPEFKALQWTSLQPNVFISTLAGPARDWISTYKNDGIKKPYQMILDADAVIAPIDPKEVGNVAGKLLALEDVTPMRRRNTVSTDLKTRAVKISSRLSRSTLERASTMSPIEAHLSSTSPAKPAPRRMYWLHSQNLSRIDPAMKALWRTCRHRQLFLSCIPFKPAFWTH